jgi:phosphoribosyl 1,2-cyclic phosphate phosphodiesterase
MRGRFTFFGTAASSGIPVIGCDCKVCLSDSPLNHRTRTSALLHVNQQQILIDVGPDFRSQALKHRLTHLDGVILTHTHYDHIAGIDDLRVFTFTTQKPLPALVSKETYEDVNKRYSYLVSDSHSPKFSFQTLEAESGTTLFLGLVVHYFSYQQTGMGVTGYRFGDLAFVTDIKEYPASILDVLQGCETLIISAIDWSPTRAHLGIEEAVELAYSVQAKRVIFTHIGHELDHESTNAKLPKFMELAYDGMSLELNF